ncbi:chromatin remodeling 1 [Rhynchospora pubera]|uniref:Chromatin remodeling 1 n=1 Tax=Rhynchospora pubera TaxID=906938 RepID=A0AAV8BVP3_9POAL|nr:chromatin remodeling 1 [Rhynchospora pubera]
MRRAYEEISDDEWDHHTSFNPRVFLNKKSKPATPPPPIESFTYSAKTLAQNGASSSSFPNTININDSDDSDFKQDDVEQEEDDEVFRASRPRRNVVRRKFVMDEDSDEHEVFDVRSTGGDGDEYGDGDGDGVNWSELENEDDDDVDVEVEILSERKSAVQERDDDLVGRALQKCAKISAALRQELYGSAAQDCDRYAEVDASSCRIVTQEDVHAACASEESDFRPILKPYQLVGVNFLLLLHRKNIGGAILADEMGLGKTVQAVTYLKVLNHLHKDPGPHLIVCPASVLENWERELKKWCPSFSIIMYHGAGRTAYSRELTSLSKTGLPPPFNVLLVGYSLFERHSEQQKEDRKALKRWQWSCVLMDEAHVLKDKSSHRWKNLMLVAQKARQRLMLTGTPLQNDLHELWSLLEFMLPDVFATGDADLKKLFNEEDRDLISRIKSILGPFILRRLKSDVMQQLVPKIQNVKYVFMGSEQSDAYDDAIEEYRAACKARVMKSSNGVPSNLIGLLPKRQISNYFTQFRKIANHPLLIRRVYGDEDVVQIGRMLYPKGVFGFQCTLERAIEEIKSYNDFAIHRLLVSYGDNGTKGALSDEDVLGSAKCQALADLLPRLMNEGHRVLIFSQWTQMLDILEWTLEVIGVTYRRLDGSTQVAERQTIVDTFNNDRSIFACLLSTRAGGQGLNLIGADTVIIHDMDFNPQMDRQAEDRCHRIGQDKPVTIYRLVTKDTVDDKIYEIAKRKLVLDAAVLESGGAELDNSNDMPERTMGEILSSLLLF